MQKLKEILATGVLKTSAMMKSLGCQIGKIEWKPLLKNRRIQVIAGACSLVLVVGVVSLPMLDKEETASALKTSLLTVDNGYDVYFKDVNLGCLKKEDTEKLDQLIEEALAKLGKENNQVYKLPEDLEKEPAIEGTALISNEEFKTSLYTALKYMKDELLVQMYVVEVENGTKVALASNEEVEKALVEVTKKYLPEGEEFQITSMDEGVTFAKAATLAKSGEKDLKLATPKRSSELMASSLATDSDGAGQEASEPVAVPAAPADEDAVNTLEFADSVKVTQQFMPQKEKLSVEEAVVVLEDYENEQVIYTVQSGDTLSGIVYGHEMTMEEVEKLNPGIKKRERYLQIGEEINITRPNPNLSVATTETIIYEESIPRETVYEYDDTKYKSWYTTRATGSDGVKKIKAELKKVDGVEEERTVTSEAVIKEPTPKVIVKGTLTPPQFIKPLRYGRISSYYGPRWGTYHRGIDIAAPYGTSIYASADGIVESAGWNSGGYGYLVVVNHQNGFKTYYAHNSSIAVSRGQRVSQGQVIAYVGSTGYSTGNHVHFEIRRYGTPINPYSYIY